MCYRVTILMLFAALPAMSVLAAPAPEPYAILDIGPPPKGETAKEHRNKEIDHLTYPHGLLLWAWSDPEVRKLPSIAALKDARYWLSKNLRVTREGEENRLRLTFRDGNRTEQVIILNALLRAYLRVAELCIKGQEEGIRADEKCIDDLEMRIKSTRDPQLAASYRKGINEVRFTRIPERRAEIARWKEVSAVRWAK